MTSCKKMVSIITPCYNAARCIQDTIQSVISQTYQDWEMLIVDDCSTDNSVEIVKSLAAKEPRIKLFSTEKPSGSPSLPRNIGIENAKGEYIAFLDADDLWLPDKLSEQVKFLENNGYKFVYSDYEKINYDGVRNNRKIRMAQSSSFWDILESCSIPCLTVLLKMNIINETRFKSTPKEDYAFWLDILKKDVIAHNTGKIHALYREQQQSRSSNKFKMISQQWFVLRNIQGVKPIVASYFMLIFLFKGFFKYLK